MGRRFKSQTMTEEKKNIYIKQNRLDDSAIKREYLILFASIGLPERYEIGYLNGKRIFFEEKENCYRMRFYNKDERQKEKSFNLVCDGKIIEDEKVINEITYNDRNYRYNVKFYFKNKGRLFNPLKPELKKQYSLWLTDRELIYVQKLLKKLRGEE